MTKENFSWVDKAFPYYEMLRVFTFYLDLECFIVSHGAEDRWHEIRRHKRATWPVEFDYLYGKRESRTAYNEAQIRWVIEKKKTLCSAYGETSSFFIPIIQKGKVLGVLQTGVFLRKVPDRTLLLNQWKELAGPEIVEFNPSFFKYVRTMLECPLLEGPVFDALQEILELYAKVLVGETDPVKARQRTLELKLKVFANHLYHKFWLDLLIKKNRFYPPSWGLGKMTDWERAEMGIENVPTTLLAVRIDDAASPKGDDLDILLRNYLFQKEMFEFSRTLPGMVASPLEDYGMLFSLSHQPGQNETQLKLEIRDRIGAISKFTSRQLKAKIITGVSYSAGPADDISRVFREAVTVLGFCKGLNRTTLFYEEIRDNPNLSTPANFFGMAKKLIEIFTSGAVEGADTARNEYVEHILSHSAGRPENVRLHFFYVFGQIVDVLRKRSPILNEQLGGLFGGLERQLQEAGDIPDLIAIFREYLKRFLAMTLKPLQSSQTLQLEAARKYIEQNFQLDLKLEEVARENGFSVSVFGRGIKRVTGMGFSAYLRKIRIDQAKRLLTSTQLPLAQLSLECGFSNLQYFFDVFKRSTGRTPQEFRGNGKSSHRKEKSKTA